MKTIQTYKESDGYKEGNKRAEERTESIVVPYIKGVSEKLRKDLGKDNINVVFKRGQTLHSMISNGKFKKKKKMIAGKKILSTEFHGEIAVYATLEREQWYDERERERNNIKMHPKPRGK